MEEGSNLKLTIEKGPREGEALEFRPGSLIRIGRVARGNTIAIKDDGISSKHLTIGYESGRWVVSDLGSSNGTVLNGATLSPSSPAGLGDGDTIKIGELTAIGVKIHTEGDVGLRRNPRRRGAGAEGTGAVNRSRRGNAKADLGVISENEESELNLEKGGVLESNTAAVAVAESRGRRGIAKANLGANRENGELGLETRGALGSNAEAAAESRSRRGRILALVSESNDLELGLEKGGDKAVVEVAAGKRNGRGRPRKDRVLKRELEDVEKVEGTDNVGSIELRKGRQVSTRITRSSRKEENLGMPEGLIIKGGNPKEPDTLVSVGDRKMRGGNRSKKIVGNEILENVENRCLVEEVLEGLTSGREGFDTIQIDVLKEEEVGKGSHLGIMESDAVQVDIMEEEVGKSLVLGQEACEALQVDVSRELDVGKGLDLGQEACEGMATKSGGKDREGPDLEKMTLGEWFDYLEVCLPRQIREETDQMILEMKQKAEQFQEFMSQRKYAREKDKVPMG
ncbi:hypothetical protein RJ639_011882 [Escallonia herrerae]|uniref:FHA domain-containing protein n=1 Tax=Escallonia herrerae TaxID=1293975 RepID=A0AA89APW6_9ASTE|nr:hypothetical protein RJ639_011882 [Escallonia herrerae]